MSRQKKIAIRICDRAAYLMFNNYSQDSKILSERELIARLIRLVENIIPYSLFSQTAIFKLRVSASNAVYLYFVQKLRA